MGGTNDKPADSRHLRAALLTTVSLLGISVGCYGVVEARAEERAADGRIILAQATEENRKPQTATGQEQSGIPGDAAQQKKTTPAQQKKLEEERARREAREAAQQKKSGNKTQEQIDAENARIQQRYQDQAAQQKKTAPPPPPPPKPAMMDSPTNRMPPSGQKKL